LIKIIVFKSKVQFLGLVHFVGDADGNIIRNNLALNVSETNQVENISQTKSVEEMGSASDLPTSESVANNGVSGDVGSEGGDVGSEGDDEG
jgi:predicted xylose isomerase-like sugar epimerase